MARVLIASAALLAACGKLGGLGGTDTPLAKIQVDVTGDPSTLPPDAKLRVALVWGAQWLPEPFCVLPAESPAAAAVIAAGCPDSFGFVPKRVAANVAVEPGAPATIQLFDLPTADLMVGDVTARVAYASLIVYDDRNGSGTLELRRSSRNTGPPDVAADAGPFDADAGPFDRLPPDVVHGASFVSMTQPDQRIGYREGGFDALAAFYPRAGCAAPPKGFSALSAGGFTEAAAIAAVLQGQLPTEDPSTCAAVSLDAGPVDVPLADDPTAVAQLACVPRTNGYARFREPNDMPDLADRTWACASVPSLGGGGSTTEQQLVVAGAETDACRSLTHYVLKGCPNDAACATPEWDLSATPPSWWPCP